MGLLKWIGAVIAIPLTVMAIAWALTTPLLMIAAFWGAMWLLSFFIPRPLE